MPKSLDVARLRPAKRDPLLLLRLLLLKRPPLATCCLNIDVFLTKVLNGCIFSSKKKETDKSPAALDKVMGWMSIKPVLSLFSCRLMFPSSVLLF